MGFGKTFSLSLVAFIGLNFIFSILYLALGPGFNELLNRFNPNSPDYAPLMIIYYLFGSVGSVPSTNMDWALVQPLLNDNMDFLVTGLGFIVAPLIAAILAGKFAESKFQGFAGWLLTVVVSTVVVGIGVFLSPTFQDTLKSETYLVFFYTYFPSLLIPGSGGFEMILIFLLIACVINIIFYGFFALLVSKTEYY